MISLATALKSEVLPMLELLEQALCRPVKLRCLDDNTQCLQAAETGYSAALRHLPRTERISIGVVHESFSDKDRHELVYQEASSHKGDMFTKRLDPSAFERALTLINLVRPDGSSFKVAWACRARARHASRHAPAARRPPSTSTSWSSRISTSPTTSTSLPLSSSDSSGCGRQLP